METLARWRASFKPRTYPTGCEEATRCADRRILWFPAGAGHHNAAQAAEAAALGQDPHSARELRLVQDPQGENWVSHNLEVVLRNLAEGSNTQSLILLCSLLTKP